MSDKILYFEDLQEGHTWKSARRTVTETDIVQFAGLSGDFNPLHVDEEFAKTTLFGKRIAHGLLGLSISTGLGSSEPPWLVMAFMGLEWRFTKPILIGDTIHCVTEIKKKREVSKGGRGIVILERKILNQNEEVVQEGAMTLLIKKRAN
jgi:3-hydroxybutyryl-CoA dehydratase